MHSAFLGFQATAATEAGGAPAGVDRYFVGRALLEQQGEVKHYRDLVEEGVPDLPGQLTFSNVKLLDGYSEGDARVLDVAVHEDLANMRNGMVVDHSADDAIYRFVFIKVGGQWKVTDFTWQFAPGSGP